MDTFYELQEDRPQLAGGVSKGSEKGALRMALKDRQGLDEGSRKERALHVAGTG